METEARLHLNVTGEQAANQKLEKFGDSAKKAGTAVAVAGKEAKNAGEQADGAGEEFREAGKDLNYLQRQADEATASLIALTLQLNRTGDTSLKKDIRAARKSRNEAVNLLKEILPSGGDAAEAAVGLGTQIAEGIGRGLSAAGPAKIGIAGIAASAAPFIGGAVAAAVIGGVGAGGIAGGIALAAQDPAVTDAARELAGSVSQAFSANGETFVGPLIESLDRLGGTGVAAAANLQPGMDALAGTIEPLADGIDGLVDGVTDGLGPAMKNAAPVVRGLAQDLPRLGDSVGDFLSTVSADPDGAILAMHTLVDITTEAIEGTGNLIAGLSAAYEWSARTAQGVTGFLADKFGWVPIAGQIYSSTNDDLNELIGGIDKAKVSSDGLAGSSEKVTYHTFQLGVAADEAAGSLEAQREAMSKLVDLELAAVGGTIAYERAVDNLAEARKENGKTLDLDTEKGRSNTEAILAGIEAVKENAEREYDLAIAHGATAQEAEEAARKYRDTFGKELRDQIIRLFGNTSAVQALLAELDKLNGKRVVYTVIQKGGRTIGHKVEGGTQLAGDEGVYRRAAGGPVRSGPMYWVGENGPELVEFKGEGYVHSASASRAMRGAAAAAGAGGGVAVNVALSAKPGTMQELVRFMLPYIQVEVISQGGDAQEVLGAPSR